MEVSHENEEGCQGSREKKKYYETGKVIFWIKIPFIQNSKTGCNEIHAVCVCRKKTKKERFPPNVDCENKRSGKNKRYFLF